YEQAVRLVRALVGREVVRLVEVHRIDRLDRHELRDLHRVRAGLFERLDLFRRELHVLVLGELVALDHLVALDDRAVLDADVLLLEARAALLVQHVEGDRVLGLGRGVQLHRNGDQSERDRERTDGAWCGHGYVPTLFARYFRKRLQDSVLPRAHHATGPRTFPIAPAHY